MRRERALALRQPRAPHQEVARSSGHRAGPWHFLPHPSFSISDRCPQFSVHSSENAPKTLERPYSTRLSHTSLKDVFQHMPTPSPGACPGRSGLCGVRRVDTGCAACGRLLTAGGWEEKGRCQGLWLPWAWWQALSSKSALAPSPSEFSPLSRHDLKPVPGFWSSGFAPPLLCLWILAATTHQAAFHLLALAQAGPSLSRPLPLFSSSMPTPPGSLAHTRFKKREFPSSELPRHTSTVLP